MSIRQRTWEIVEAAKPGDKVSLLFDVAVLSLIFLNVLAVIFGSVQFVEERWGTALRVFEAASLIVFSLEYIARLWSCTADRQYAGRGGRVRFALMPMPIIDLAVILPLYLPFLGIDLRSLRILRLLRMLTLAKIGRYYSSFNLIQQVFRTKKEELVLTSAVLGLLRYIVQRTLLLRERGTAGYFFKHSGYHVVVHRDSDDRGIRGHASRNSYWEVPGEHYRHSWHRDVCPSHGNPWRGIRGSNSETEKNRADLPALWKGA
jgi:hypothetical protein